MYACSFFALFQSDSIGRTPSMEYGSDNDSGTPLLPLLNSVAVAVTITNKLPPQPQPGAWQMAACQWRSTEARCVADGSLVWLSG